MFAHICCRAGSTVGRGLALRSGPSTRNRNSRQRRTRGRWGVPGCWLRPRGRYTTSNLRARWSDRLVAGARKGDLVIPSQPGPEDDRTRSGLDQSGADADQTRSDADQTRSDRDQRAADRDQLAADSDQAASDRDLAHGVDRAAYDSSREARERTTETRRMTAASDTTAPAHGI